MNSQVAVCPDSFAFLRGLDPGAVDVIITDPPYSPHVQSNLCSGSLVGKKSVPKYELPFRPLTDYDFIGDCVRIAKRWVVVFCDLEAFGIIAQKYPADYVRGCVWVKPNAMGQLTKDRPATAYEGIALLHGKADHNPLKRWNGKGSYAVWKCNGTRGEKGRHPNQKPLDLCMKLVVLFSERGETVLDPFCGSGRIGEACVSLGRNYVGLDNDEEWVARAQERLAATAGRSDEYALSLCRAFGPGSDDPPMEEVA